MCFHTLFLKIISVYIITFDSYSIARYPQSSVADYRTPSEFV